MICRGPRFLQQFPGDRSCVFEGVERDRGKINAQQAAVPPGARLALLLRVGVAILIKHGANKRGRLGRKGIAAHQAQVLPAPSGESRAWLSSRPKLPIAAGQERQAVQG